MLSMFPSPVPLRIQSSSISTWISKLRLIFLLCFAFAVIFSLLISKSSSEVKRSEEIVAERTTQKPFSPLNKIFKHGVVKRDVKSVVSDEVENVSVSKKEKILCYVLLSRRKLATARIIKETWGSRCDKLVFYGKFHNKDLPVTFLNATEGYEYLWGKTKAALIHLEKHFSMDYKWFLKADDDTFVIVENLRDFIDKLDTEKPVWFGNKLRHKRMPQGYMSGGAGYVFSTTALSKVVRVLKEENAISAENEELTPNVVSDGKDEVKSCNVHGKRGIEDLELGKCFLAAGVEDVNTVDKEDRERFLPLSLNDLLNGEISSFHWIWRQAWNPIKTGEKCCSTNVISMHQISPNEMRTIHFLLYKLKISRRH